jgi:hypothetical protein
MSDSPVPASPEEAVSLHQEIDGEGEELAEGYWRGEIIKERPARKGKGKEYLVKWLDIDPKTGKLYPPGWVRIRFVTKANS